MKNQPIKINPILKFSKKFLWLWFCLFSAFAFSQPPEPKTSTSGTPPETQIEDIISQSEEETTFDFNTQFEHLEHYARSPLNLNKATQTELEDFGLFTPLQIAALLDYRKTVGQMISIYELQAVPYFDLATIQQLLPYLKVGRDADDVQVSFQDLFTKGNNEIFLRSRRIVQQQDGYLPVDETGETPYLGDPNYWYLRYKHSYGNKFSYGVTMEKDAGEDFFKGNNQQGFDFYSAHLYLHNYSALLKDVVVGDYQVNMGQGLIIRSGFGTRKSAYVMDIKNSGRTLKSYSSVNEAIFMRGGGLTLGLGKKWDFTTFASVRQRDANVTLEDTLDLDIEVLEISSLQRTGLHRTIGEIEDENSIQQFNTGGTLKYKLSRGHIALNGLYTQLSAPLQVNDRLANLFRFRGRTLLNASLDYAYLLRNIHFFGETAISDNGGIATLNGAMLSLNRFINLGVLHRHFEKDYQTLFGQAFSETSGVQNETGLYTGLEIKPNREWHLTFYFDSWKHPWLRSNATAPSKGYEYLGQVNYRPRRYTEVYFRFRQENKERNTPNNTTKTNLLTDVKRTQARFHFSHKINDQLDVRSRIELSWYNNSVETPSKGFLAYQDVIYKPQNSDFSFAMRYALFDTDDFNSRIYTYEKDILYAFSIPAYAYKGTRTYFYIKYRPIKLVTFEARIGQTRFSDQEEIGSGLERIDGNKRTDVKLQVRMRF